MVFKNLIRFKMFALLVITSLFFISMQSRWHGYRLAANGKLKSHSSISKFSLILIHPSHEKNTTLTDNDYLNLLYCDTSYEVCFNSLSSAIPNDKQFFLFKDSPYHSIQSKKDSSHNQSTWSGCFLKKNRYYLLVFPETRLYNRRPLIFFRTGNHQKLQAVERGWDYQLFN